MTTTSDIHTTTERHYNVSGKTDDIPGALRDALAERATEHEDDRTWHITLWGRFGYRVTAEFSDDGICHRYTAKKTGYDGDFRIEGRGYTNDVLSLLDMFFWNDGTPTTPSTPESNLRAMGDRTNGRHFQIRDGRLTAYSSTLSPARLNSEDFGKTF